MRRPSVIAHRGASGYEYENSRAAFRRAVMLDADGVELDVHATRDGGIVVHHDPDVPGLRSDRPDVAGRSPPGRIRNGERLPLLAEILRAGRRPGCLGRGEDAASGASISSS